MIWFLVLIVVIAALFGLMRLGEKEMKKKEEGKPKDNQRPTVFKTKGRTQSRPESKKEIIWEGSKQITIEYMNKGEFTVKDIELTCIWDDLEGEMYFEGYGQTFWVDGVIKLKNAKGRNFENFYDYMEKDLKI